jgi:hypothetical protein
MGRRKWLEKCVKKNFERLDSGKNGAKPKKDQPTMN